MKDLLFVTTNIDKFQRAQTNLAPYGIQLIQKNLHMEELQSEDGEEIARHKALQAFAEYKQPVIVNDDTWSVPALNGFPSTAMKLCNSYLKARNWLRLMQGIKDRRIFLIAYFAYHDGTTIHVTSQSYEMYFLEEPQGTHTKAPCLEVVAPVGSAKSMAELISKGTVEEKENQEFWKDFSDLLLKK